LDDKRIVVHPGLKIRQRRVVRQDPAARIRLQAADEQEDAVSKATLDPCVMTFQKLRRLALVVGKLQQHEKHRLVPP
jgi:hypothetical protein